MTIIVVAALLSGCAGGPPGNPSSASQPRQNCAACIEENPGNVSVCEAICHEREGNTDSSSAGSVLR